MAFLSLQNCWFCWILHGLNITTAFIPGGILLFGIETAAADFCLIAGQLKHGQGGVRASLSISEGVGSQWGNGGGRKSLILFFFLFNFSVFLLLFPSLFFPSQDSRQLTGLQSRMNGWRRRSLLLLQPSVLEWE